MFRFDGQPFSSDRANALYGKGIDEILERVAIGADGQTWVYYPQQNHEGSVTLLSRRLGQCA